MIIFVFRHMTNVVFEATAWSVVAMSKKKNLANIDMYKLVVTILVDLQMTPFQRYLDKNRELFLSKQFWKGS